MRQNINVEDAFRLWVRTMLEQMLGDEPGNVRYGIFPVKQFTQITIEEVFLYIGRKQFQNFFILFISSIKHYSPFFSLVILDSSQ